MRVITSTLYDSYHLVKLGVGRDYWILSTFGANYRS